VSIDRRLRRGLCVSGGAPYSYIDHGPKHQLQEYFLTLRLNTRRLLRIILMEILAVTFR
jgi:hypothetical protein